MEAQRDDQVDINTMLMHVQPQRDQAKDEQESASVQEQKLLGLRGARLADGASGANEAHYVASPIQSERVIRMASIANWRSKLLPFDVFVLSVPFALFLKR